MMHHVRRLAVLILVAVPLLLVAVPAQAAPQRRAITPADLVRLAKCETGGTMNPAIRSKTGKFHGLYQFSQTTWDATAKSAGRFDLVGLPPSTVHHLNQTQLAIVQYNANGGKPWPHCGRFLPR